MTAGFVRAARSSDAAGLARVQVASWRTTLASAVPPEVLAELTSADAEQQWAERWLEAITSPPTSRHRVYVAVEPDEPGPVGFAAAGPATDDDLWPGTDAELYELHVLPELIRQGHGGRLLHAAADTFAEDGFHTAFTWALSADDARLSFLESAGWAPDGSHTNLDMGVKVHVVRLHTRLEVLAPGGRPPGDPRMGGLPVPPSALAA